MKSFVIFSVVVLVILCTGVIGDLNQCVFPFKYDGKTYNKCTYASHSVPWCAYDHEYQRSRWDNCVCSESEERRLNCAAQRKGCLPAADEEPARCYGLDHHYAGIGRR